MDMWSHFNDSQITVLTWAAIMMVITVAVALVVIFIYATWRHIHSISEELSKYIIRIGGLSGMGVGSLVIISIFRNTADPIKMNILGVEFSGGSGPIVLWAFLFLSMVAGSVAIFKAT